MELTAREREVLRGLARGESNREIAAALGIAAPTVRTHLMAIYVKLGATSRVEALVEALRRGLVTVEPAE